MLLTSLETIMVFAFNSLPMSQLEWTIRPCGVIEICAFLQMVRSTAVPVDWLSLSYAALFDWLALTSGQNNSRLPFLLRKKFSKFSFSDQRSKVSFRVASPIFILTSEFFSF